MCKVSIVVPIYNPGKKLKKCIESVLKQTFIDFELILVNDGSTDNSFDICNRYALQDKRIKVINKENEGLIKTRRRGIEEAKSDYIMFIDSDDWVDIRIIEVLYNEIIDNNCDIVVCNSYKVLGDRAIIKKENNSQYFKENKIYEGDSIRTELVEAYLHGHPFPASIFAKMYKKNLLLDGGKYLDKIKFLGEDLFYNIEIFLKSNKVKVINKPLYYYRAGGFTSKFMPYHFDDIVNGYEIQKEVISDNYKDRLQKSYNGISIMLLNSFKMSLYNIINSGLNKEEIKKHILLYIDNNSIKEAIRNKGSIIYFEEVFIDAIENKDVNYLYQIGKDTQCKFKLRSNVVRIISKLNIL